MTQEDDNNNDNNSNSRSRLYCTFLSTQRKVHNTDGKVRGCNTSDL